MSGGPIVMIALDAVDPELAGQWAAEGLLPNLQRLFAGGARARVTNPIGIVGAFWMNFSTCQTVARHRFHCWEVIDPSSYEKRPATPDWRCPPFWERLSDAGCRIAVIDIPHTHVERPLNGIVVGEWGSHDRHFGFHTSPPALAARIEREVGLNPVLGVDTFAVRDFSPDDDLHRSGAFRTAEEDSALMEGLRGGLELRRKLLRGLMAENEWDLFLGMICEGHAAGHQLWHLHDPEHIRHDPAKVEAIGGDPLLRIYRDIDAAIGAMLEQAPADAAVLVLMSHGMGPHYNGAHLLEEVLTRLDRFHRGEPSHRSRADRLRSAIRPVVPLLQRLAGVFGLSKVLRLRLGRKIALTTFAPPEVRARQRWFLAPNNHLAGGVRLNRKGREAQGCVEPGEVDQLCEQLAADLLEIINLGTGRPMVRSVERTDRHYRRSDDDTLPDLLLEWDRSGPIETVASPKIGTVHIPDRLSRSGDHRPNGLLIGAGPGFVPGQVMPPIRIEDIGPSIAARFGTTLDDVEGEPVAWLAGSEQ